MKNSMLFVEQIARNMTMCLWFLVCSGIAVRAKLYSLSPSRVFCARLQHVSFIHGSINKRAQNAPLQIGEGTLRKTHNRARAPSNSADNQGTAAVFE